MALAALVNNCPVQGDCDHCPENDCIANDKECLRYYGKEEKICEQRYGKESMKQEQMVCTTACGNTGCTYNSIHNKLPEDKTPWQATRYTRYCGGYVKPAAGSKKKKGSRK